MKMCADWVLFAVVTVLHCICRTDGQTEVTMKVPRTVDDCYSQALLHPIDPRSAKVDCMQRLLWFYEPDQNLTREVLGYFGSLKGNAHGDPAPKTGFRTRKEYRRLSEAERGRLHEAFNKLYQKGILRRYADLHRNAIETARDGAAFLSWHRVFLAMFEDELRLMDPAVSLPYWDSSLDHNMDNGVNSVIWSLNFLGNANGEVNTGPFAGWITSRGRLWRRYGTDGILISPEKIAKIMTKCQTNDIVFPVHPPADFSTLDYMLEFHSNGVHKWLGGDMADGYFAAYDPVFYMHQAYIDYLWEYFRHKQKTVCGINPETAYANPPYRPGQGPDDLMYGFSEFKNIDGLREYWTRSWYDYEVVPECPNCGSKYLHCDQKLGRCVAHSRRTDFNAGRYRESPRAIHFGISSEPFEPLSIVLPKRNVYAFLPSPSNDHRTRITALRDSKRSYMSTPSAPYVVYRAPPVHVTESVTPAPPPPPTSMSKWIQNLEPPPLVQRGWPHPHRSRTPPSFPVTLRVRPRSPPPPPPVVAPPLAISSLPTARRDLPRLQHQGTAQHTSSQLRIPRPMQHRRRPPQSQGQAPRFNNFRNAILD